MRGRLGSSEGTVGGRSIVGAKSELKVGGKVDDEICIESVDDTDMKYMRSAPTKMATGSTGWVG